MNIPQQNPDNSSQSALENDFKQPENAPTSKKPPVSWRKMLICVFTGFSSGLPLYFVWSLIPAWLKDFGLDLATIGAFALIQLPFAWKFLWAPLLDAYTLPFLGRRRGWLIVTQVVLICSIAAFGMLNPQVDIGLVVALCLCLTLFSATQDIVIDTFRREILSDAELGLGNSIHVAAYRIAGFVPGALALILADFMSWQSVFFITALFMLPGIIMTLMVKEPPTPDTTPKNLQDTFILPFKEFFNRKGVQHALLVLAFIFFYKLGDSMATALATPFYMDMGFSKTQIGLIAKNAGLWPMIVAGIIGGMWMVKLGINRALWIFGFVQIITILGFVWLSSYGRFDSVGDFELWLLAAVIAAEAIGAGLGTAAFVSFIARETNPAYTATQIALLTALSAFPRTFINATTGYLIKAMGYYHFFWLCFFLAIPGMLLLFKVAPWREK